MNNVMVGDKVRIKKDCGKYYFFTQDGSEGVVIRIDAHNSYPPLGGAQIQVKFSKLTCHDEIFKDSSGIGNGVFWIHLDHLEYVAKDTTKVNKVTSFRRIVL